MTRAAWVTSVKATMLAKAGKQKEAEDAIQHAIEIRPGLRTLSSHVLQHLRPLMPLRIGRELALKWLQVTAEEGFPCYPLFQGA